MTQSEKFLESNSDILRPRIATQTWLSALRWSLNSQLIKRTWWQKLL